MRLKISVPGQDISGDSPSESDSSASGGASGGEATQSVGTRLHRARTQAGHSQEEVAAYLKIRLVYIRAIEDGRYADLPGAAYAIGFVRSYAEHLGLDPDSMARDFRSEAEGLNRPSDLHFPELQVKSQIPPLLVTIVSLLVVISLYMGSHYWMALWRGIPPVADDFSSTQGEDNISQDMVAAPREDEGQFGGVREHSTDTTGDMSFDDAETADATTPDPYPQGGKDRFYWNSSLGRFMPRFANVSESNVPESNVSESTDLNPADSPLEQFPRVYGQQDQNARIMVESVRESWVEIRNTQGEVILTRVLYPGDRFYVPDTETTVLTTGNAGGLRVVVDGRVVEPLGQDGHVVRGVILDADGLLAGRIDRLETPPFSSPVLEENATIPEQDALP